MTHPKNKLERLLIADQRAPVTKRKRSWKKLTIDTIREWEAESEIKHNTSG